MEEIKLTTEDIPQIIQDVLKDFKTEKQRELAKKVRHVLMQIEHFKGVLKKIEIDKKKAEEKLGKAVMRLEKVQQGDWNVINSINPDSKFEEEKGEQNG